MLKHRGNAKNVKNETCSTHNCNFMISQVVCGCEETRTSPVAGSGRSPEVSYLAWPLMRFWSAQHSSLFSSGPSSQCCATAGLSRVVSVRPKKDDDWRCCSWWYSFWNFLFKEHICAKKARNVNWFSRYRVGQPKFENYAICLDRDKNELCILCHLEKFWILEFDCKFRGMHPAPGSN